ncbi:trypsin-like serine peptidase [Streptomyces sp. NPDC050161]|uniref:trypsin-like serine peptidase n=1 Tax=Streptomyces sp. NPDC050161 TaxID=3365604 RepID=UPI0037ADDF68
MTTPLDRAGGPQRPAGKHLRRTAALAVAVFALGTALPAPASAAPSGPRSATAPAEVAVHDQAVGEADQKAVLDYWTPQRIAALNGKPSDNPPRSGPDGAPWTGGSALTRTVGRLFFTDHGEDSSCTATVVDSANGSTVVTAGHCVNNGNLLGEDNQWSTHMMFVPGYHDGAAPYGKFVGRLGVAAATWLQNDAQHSEKFDGYDQAFVVLNRDARGGRLQDVVGAAQKIGFDEPGDGPVHQFGYPRAASDPAREGLPEYTGARLAYCTGQAREYPGTPDWPEPKGQWGTACVMGGGSSGGPRIAGLDPKSGLGTVVGDNTTSGFFDSAGHVCADDTPGCVRHLVGPQFTSDVTGPLYARAQRTS